MERKRAVEIEEVLARHLPMRRYDGLCECWIRTVYLDSKSGDVSRAILENPGFSTKLRVRSYSDGERSAGGRVWVEVKHRRGFVVAKSRFQTARSALPTLLRGGTPPESDEQAEFARVRGLRGLVPTVIVDYRRRSYESADGALRMTLDADLSARPVDADYFDRPPIASGAGVALLAGDARIFEIKLRGGASRMPDWLLDSVGGTRPDGYSKAAAALRMVAAAWVAQGVES